MSRLQIIYIFASTNLKPHTMSKTIRAKFTVSEVSKYGGCGGTKIVLSAVTVGSEENKSFSQYTPSGKIEMMITVDEVAKQFSEMGEYYIDFTKAEETPAAE